MYLSRVPVFLILLAAVIHAEAFTHETVRFRHEATVAGAVFVLGDLEELGGDDITKAIQLVQVAEGIWEIDVRLPVNRTYTYRFYQRNVFSSTVGNPTNGTPLTDPITGNTSTVALEPSTKAVHYRGALETPQLHWRQDEGAAFATLSLAQNGEWWEITSFGESHREVEFFFTNATGTEREPASLGGMPEDDPTFATKLDAIFVQGGELFGYLPASHVSSPQRDDAEGMPLTLDSTILQETRPYRVLLPRGYEEHSDRYYPVILFMDGQGLFEEDQTVDGNASNPQEALDPDGTVISALIASGQMHEAIVVGVDALSLVDRWKHYVPLGEKASNQTGIAEVFAEFLWLELLPHLQANYRILSGPENTGAIGYELGGLLALYLGWDYPNVFGRVGALSMSNKARFLSAMRMEVKREHRLYIDSGTNQFSTIRGIRDNLVSKPTGRYVVDDDLRYRYAAGQSDTPENFRSRLPEVLPFLFPAEEPRETNATAAAIPYWLQFYGLTPEVWDLDLDGDGYSTLSEYGFGTDPLDGDSHLGFTGIDFTDGSWIEWQSQPGIPIEIDQSLDLVTWDPLGDSIVGTGELFEALIPFPDTDVSLDRAFFRARGLPAIDSDRDGLSDVEEIVLLGTNADVKDTDNDTFDDGLEVLTMGTDPLVPNVMGGSIAGRVSRDENEDGSVAGDPAVPGAVLFLDLNFNGMRDATEPTQEADANGHFEFPNIAPGTYHVRQELPLGWIQTFPGGFPETPDGLPDTVVSFEHSGEGSFPEPYGILADPWEIPFIDVFKSAQVVDPEILLKPIGQRAATPPAGVMSTTEFVTISNQSAVTLKFEDEQIINGPGYDFQIVTLGANQDAGEMAELYVGATADDLHFVGIIGEYGNIGIDLDRFDLHDPVQVIRLISLNNAGRIPGFEWVGTEAIHYRPTSNHFHVVTIGEQENVAGVDFGRLGRDLPPRVYVTTESGTANAGDPIVVQVSGVDDLGIPTVSMTVNGAVVALDGDGRATITPPYPGDLVISATATDAAGQTTEQSLTIAIRNADGSLPDVPGSPSLQEREAGAPTIVIESPGAGKIVEGDTSLIARITGIQVDAWQCHLAPVDAIDPYAMSVPDADYQLLAQGNGPVEQGAVATIPADSLADGIYFVRVSASSGGVTAYSGHTIGVRVSGADLFPQIELTAPEPNADITYLTDLVGSIQSLHPLREWYVEIGKSSDLNLDDLADIDDAALTRLAEGSEAMPTGSLLTTLDPTLLPNDQYVMKVTAWNDLGLGWTEGVVINVGGNAKLGRLRTEFTDMVVPLAGIPIEIKRVYDSFDTDTSGDFGYGWRIGYASPEVNETVPDHGAIFATNAYRDGTRVYLNAPDGRRIGFTFRLELAQNTFLGASYRAVFEPDPGVYEHLSVPEGDAGFLSQADNGDAVLSLFGLAYNPDVFILTTKEGLRYTYHEQDGLVAVNDDHGNQLIFTKDGVAHSSGVSVDFERDASGRIIGISDPGGMTWEYGYNGLGELISVTDPSGVEVTLTYHADPAHYLDEIIDPLGRTGVQYEYDAEGRLAAIIDENGNRSEQTWDLGGFMGTLSNYRGDITTIQYNARGNVISEEDSLGGVTTYAYEDPEHPDLETAITDPRGHTTTYQYDSNGNPTRMNPPLGNRTDWEYNDANKITKRTGPNLHGDVYTYNDKNQVIIHNVGGNDEILYTYDDFGSVASQTNAEGVFTAYRYGGAFGQIDEILSQDGQASQLIYDAASGLPEQFINTYGGQTTYKFDAAGRLVEEMDPYGNSTVVELENGELKSSTSRGGMERDYQFNAEGQLTEESIGGATTAYTYDADGNRISVTDPLGNMSVMTYDANDRLLSYTDAHGRSITHLYDLAGNRIQSVDRNGRKRTFEYDGLNRMTAERWHDPNDDSVIREIVFEYNRFQRLAAVIDGDLRYDFRSLGNVNVTGLDVTFPGMSKQAVSYFYANVTELIKVSHASAHFEYARDSRGNVGLIRWITPGNDVSARLEIERVLGGLPNEWRRYKHRFGGDHHFIGATGFTWDLTGQPLTIHHEDALGVTLPTQGLWTYTRNAERHVASEDDGFNLATYQYGAQGQLTAVSHSQRADEMYSVDLNGNRTSHTVTVGNRISEAGDFEYDWDHEGNLIQRRDTVTGEIMDLAWDYRNRLVSVERRPSVGAAATETVGYQYDYRDLQIGRTVNGTTTWTYYGIEEMPYFEFTGVDPTPTAMYLHDPDTMDRFYGKWTADTGIHWFLTDHQDSVRQVLDDVGTVLAQMDYDAFGNVVNLTETNPGDAGTLRFTGRIFDEVTGFYYHRARYFDPVLGRFLSEDPLGYDGGDSNLYRYAKNDPVNYTDPSGNVAASNYGFTLKIAKRARKYGKKVGEQIYDCFIGIAESLENASNGNAKAGDTSECTKWPGI